ncbi:ABC transporter permease subunit [Fodinicurvata halophila]|uniref:ABC transporter permease subunit n=1 Tax=Fodinicurvata halophila TaxID=1419723 RepID=UPI00363F9A29
MDLSIFTVLTLNGLTQAGLLFITASGLTLAFGLMRVVNLAHGAFYMLGGYTGVAAYQMSGSLIVGVMAGGVIALLLGVFTERVLLVRIRGMELSEAMMTIAIGMIIADTMLAIYGGIQNPWRRRPNCVGR